MLEHCFTRCLIHFLQVFVKNICHRAVIGCRSTLRPAATELPHDHAVRPAIIVDVHFELEPPYQKLSRVDFLL